MGAENGNPAEDSLWYHRGIRPISTKDVGRHMDSEWKEIRDNKEKYKAARLRGAEELLDPNTHDYAMLPGNGGKTAEELLRTLPSGSVLLDVGCGEGKFAMDLLPANKRERRHAINPNIEVWGFDAVEWP